MFSVQYYIWCFQDAEEVYITNGAIATFTYFAWFIVIMPVIGIIENTLMDIATGKQS